jgi:hypothetical protein
MMEISDVLAIRIECVKCGAAIALKPTEWKDAPFQCPGCGNMWDVPHLPDAPPSPLQHLGIGLKLLHEHAKAEPPKLRVEGAQAFPYRVKFEFKDQR